MNDTEFDFMLASLNPYPGRDSDPGFDSKLDPGPDPRRGEVLAAIASRVRQRRRHRRAVLAAPILLGGALATTAAAAVLSATPAAPQETINIACEAAVNGDVTTGVIADGPDPVAQCAGEWRAGAMIQGVTIAPTMQACVAAGRLTVYPSKDACSTLREPGWAGYTSQQREAIAVSSAVRQTLAGPCVTVENAVVRVRQLFKAQHVSGWSVTSAGTGCAWFRLDLSDHTISIAP